MRASPARPAQGDLQPEAVRAVLYAVRQAADVLCDRWSLALMAAALEGERRFGDLQARTGAARALVASRLRSLEQDGLLAREPYCETPLRHAYRPTPAGEALRPVLVQMLRWEQGQGRPVPAARALLADPGGRPLATEVGCSACGRPVGARDIDLQVADERLAVMPAKQTTYRRSTATGAGAGEGPLGPILDIFGDKWSIEILVLAFLRVRRFGQFQTHAAIASNILSDRLARLTAGGLLVQGRDCGYRLTEAGLDLYGVLVAINDWADAWLPDRSRSPLRLIHRDCGATFHPAPLFGIA